MDGEVYVSNDSQRLLAAAETKNNGRGAQQQLRRGPWFVFLCLYAKHCLESCSSTSKLSSIVLALHDVYYFYYDTG